MVLKTWYFFFDEIDTDTSIKRNDHPYRLLQYNSIILERQIKRPPLFDHDIRRIPLNWGLIIKLTRSFPEYTVRQITG